MKGPKPVPRTDTAAADAAEKLADAQALEAAREAFKAVKAAREQAPDPPT